MTKLTKKDILEQNTALKEKLGSVIQGARNLKTSAKEEMARLKSVDKDNIGVAAGVAVDAQIALLRKLFGKI